MEIRIFDTAQEAARAAAMVFAGEILKKPDCVIGLATGSTPLTLYREMARLNREGIVSFARVTSFNLDEYVGLPADHPESYRRFMDENLFQHIDIDRSRTFVPSGMAADPEAEAARYEQAVRDAGGVDVQLLGIGRNGHIAFNEPNDCFVRDTNVISLTDSTIAANARFFASADEVPKQAICMGIGTIFAARRIVLIATGAEKAEAVRRAVKGDVTPSMPASILQFHPNCQVLLDRDAARNL